MCAWRRWSWPLAPGNSGLGSKGKHGWRERMDIILHRVCYDREKWYIRKLSRTFHLFNWQWNDGQCLHRELCWRNSVWFGLRHKTHGHWSEWTSVRMDGHWCPPECAWAECCLFCHLVWHTHTHTRVHHWLTHSPDLKESLTLKCCFYTLVCADSMSTQSPPGTLYMQILPCTETHKDYTNTTTTGGRGGRGVTTHSLAKNPQGEIWSLSNSEQIIKLVYEIHRGAGSDTHRQSFGSGGVLPPQL